MKVKEIKELIKILAETDITELKLERYGTKVEIKKDHLSLPSPL